MRSLTFQSNRKTYGPFGVEQGTYFSFPMTGGKIVGFHGRCGWYLDAIGIYLKSVVKKVSSNTKAMLQTQNYYATQNEKTGYSLVQGSVGENYDIVLAVRQKDSFGNSLPSVVSKQKDSFRKTLPVEVSKQKKTSSSSSSSDDSSDDEKDKVKYVLR